MADKKTYRAQEVCNELNVSKKTLYNWEDEGKIPKPKRDWRGWRIYSEDDVEEIRRLIDEKASQY